MSNNGPKKDNGEHIMTMSGGNGPTGVYSRPIHILLQYCKNGEEPIKHRWHKHNEFKMKIYSTLKSMFYPSSQTTHIQLPFVLAVFVCLNHNCIFFTAL